MPDDEDDASARVARELFLLSFLGGSRGIAHVAQVAARLASVLRNVSLKDGDILYRRDDPSESYYFIVAGEVELVTDDAPTWRFGPRSVIGALDSWIGRPRSRTAHIRGPTQLLALEAHTWLDLLEDDFEVTRGVLRNMSEGLHLQRVALPPEPAPPLAMRAVSNDAKLPSELPVRAASTELNLAERAAALRTVSCFLRARVQSVLMLAEAADEIRVGEGDVVSLGGEESGSILVLVSGRVEVAFEPAWRMEQVGGSIVGGPEALGGRLPRGQVVAKAACTLLRLGLEDYWDAMEEHFDLARASIRAVAEDRERLLNRGSSGRR